MRQRRATAVEQDRDYGEHVHWEHRYLPTSVTSSVWVDVHCNKWPRDGSWAYLIRITDEETGHTELFGTDKYNSESIDSCIEKGTIVNSGQERRAESVTEAGVERQRRASIMENEELRYDRWNSTPWPGWVKPKEAGQPGNRSVRYQGEVTLDMRRIGTPPEVRGQERLTTRSAWTNSGASQGSGVGSDDKLLEANLWGDMVRWLGCAPIQKDKEEKMSGGKATSIPGSGVGSGKGATYGNRSMERFKTTVISKSRTTRKSLGKGTHMIVPSGGESGEYWQRDTGDGLMHELGNKRDLGQEEQHRKNLVDGVTQVIVSNIEELCFLVAIDLDPELWQIEESNRMGFMGYIADVIIRVTRIIEEQMEVEVSTDKGAKKREFCIIVYHDVASLRKQFDEDYRNLGGFLISESDDTPIFGLIGTRSSPTLESPTSNVRIKPEVGGGTSTFESPQSSTHIRDTQFSSISPGRVLVVCQLCGSGRAGKVLRGTEAETDAETDGR